MSICYSISIILNIPFNRQFIKKVLDQGIAAGGSYYDRSNELNITAEYALHCVWQEIEAESPMQRMFGISGSCYFLYLQTSQIMMFFNHNGMLSVSIIPSGGKCYTQPDFLDYNIYTKLLLYMCREFEILHFWCNDNQYSELFEQNPQIAFEPNRDHAYPRQQYVMVTITQKFSLEYITRAFNGGVAAGWKFLKLTSNETLQLLTTEQAVSIFMSTPIQDCFQECMANDHHMSPLCGIINGRYYGIKIGKRSTCHITISVIPIDHPNAVASPFNFHHALRDIFDLCTPFGIIEVTTFDSWYNTYYIPQLEV